MQKINARRGSLSVFWREVLKMIVKQVKYMDIQMLIAIVALMVFGTGMVFTSSTNMASGSALSFFGKQVLFAIIALIAMIVMTVIPIRWHSKGISKIIVFSVYILIGVLIYTFLFTDPVSGAKGWINFGFLSFQPVEYFKIALILWFAYRFSHRQLDSSRTWHSIRERLNIHDILPPLFGVILSVAMPDMGGAAILTFIILTMVFTSGIKVRGLSFYILAIVAFLVVLPYLLPIISKTGLMAYQLKRLETYANPWADLDSGHQLINSYYAISNGGLFGRGLGNSIQKTGYLPEPNTDFIMAVVGEELGAVSILIVLAVFGFILWRLIHFALQTPSMQYRLMLYGISAYITIQILINLGGVVGLLPITGVTFPMISYGGSSLLSWGITFGIAFNVIGLIKQQQEYEKERASV